MSAHTRPLRLVVFASEQLVPTLQFTLHCAEQFGQQLHAVHVFHTPDARRSLGPAQRLKDLLSRWSASHAANGAGFDVVLGCGAANPGGVRDVLLKWFGSAPEDEWLVNVTGGTKPMSAAAVELTLSTDLPSRRVLYQELGSGWSEMVQNNDGFLDMDLLSSDEDVLVPKAGVLERLLPIQEFVSTQFSADHAIHTQDLPEKLPVDQTCQALLSNGWRWQDALTGLPTPVASTSNGVAFELFLGAGLRDCGLQVQHSLKVIDLSSSGVEGKVVREIDLVACYRDRLICIDIKLPNANDDQKGTQLADVAELARSLGGHNALAVAVRPGWPSEAGTLKLANALGVKLLTQVEAGRPFSALLEWIDKDGLQPSKAVLDAQALLLAHQKRGNTVLSDGRFAPKPHLGDSGMLHLPKWAEETVQLRGEPWALVQIKDQRYWLGIPKKLAPVTQLTDWPTRSVRLKQLMHDSSDAWVFFDYQETDAWVTVQFAMKTGLKRDAFLQRLRDLLITELAGK